MTKPIDRFARRMVWLAACALLTGVSCGAPPNEEVEGELTAGAVADVSFDLEAERYVRYRLATHRVATHLSVLGPDGRVLAESRGGDEMTARTLALVAPAGRHVVRIEGVAGHGTDSYALLQAENRRPGPDAGRRVEAWATLQEIAEALGPVTREEKARLVAVLEGLGGVFEELEDPVGRAATRKARGDLLFWQGEVSGALAAYEAGLNVLGRSRGDPRLRAELLTHVANCLSGPSPREAAGIYRQAVRAWEDIGDPWWRLDVENSSAMLVYRDEELDAAQERFEEILARRRDLGDRQGEGVTLASLGPVYRQKGNSAAALDVYHQATTIARELGIPWLLSQSRFNQGVLNRSAGDLQTALRQQQDALEADMGLLTPDILKELGLIYRRLGRPAEALAYLKEGLEGVDAGQLDLRADLHASSGWAHLDLEQPGEAARSFDQALDVFADMELSGNTGFSFAVTRLGRVRAARRMGETVPLEEVRAPVELLLAGQHVSGRVFGWLELAEAQRSARAWADSRESWKRALELSRRHEQTGYEREALLGLARTARDLGDRDAALRHVRAAIGQDDTARLAMTSESLRGSYLARSQEAYDLEIELLGDRYAATGDPATAASAWEVHERRKGQMLLERLERRGLETLPESVRRRRDRIAGRLVDARRELDLLPDTEHAAAAVLRREIRDLEEEFLDLERTREREDQDVTRLAPVPLADVQAQLGPGDAVVEYALGAERSFVFVVTRDGLLLRELAVTAAEVAGRVEKLLGTLRSAAVGTLAERRGSSGSWLSDHLLAPIGEGLAGVRRLVVVPDRALWRLPFEALPWGDGYALHRWSFVVVPSATVWARLRDDPTPCTDDRVVAFADPLRADDSLPPLPYARKEVERLGGRVLPFVGAEATEHRVKSSDVVRRACRLHFASHAGVYPGARAVFSGLHLAPGDGEDGELQVYEIADLSLEADLVVLSACDSGLGESLRGEGFLGFTQAFFTAGVRNLVVSLWPVDDDESTVELMADFYRALRMGKSPGEALHWAKLRATDPDPAAWSAFVLVGRG